MEMIRHWGYPAESYDVISEDGYILDLFRIPHGRHSEANATCHRPVVLMVHGQAASATEYFLNPPESSPAFILADAGFDIFLSNQRGTTYGKRHKTLSPTFGSKFWQFTQDDFARYDETAVIDKVLELTGEKSVHWVGNSQGTFVGFILLAGQPEYNRKVKALF
ncbi:hypothetical protein PENTCL1PPCAC_128 [Pristionchus entomophagus]|uniref:Partial AB-hydrolase lipase domain-containing protein n=1 Tax=Pristionchus entomophagus TaxID=358040 RepID=A0AAV5SBH1_9BILA|nr:hypothetical protein PENTCL1PPCAC_128 [Pristionchus entomophagus]